MPICYEINGIPNLGELSIYNVTKKLSISTQKPRTAYRAGVRFRNEIKKGKKGVVEVGQGCQSNYPQTKENEHTNSSHIAKVGSIMEDLGC